MKQTEMILAHLRHYGSITQLEALQEYGIARLASRINDLRQSGVAIKTERETAKNRYGVASSFAKYVLEDNE